MVFHLLKKLYLNNEKTNVQDDFIKTIVQYHLDGSGGFCCL